MKNYRKNDENNWFKQHADTVIVMGGILTSIVWMNTRFNEIDRRIYDVETRLKVIETVLVMKNIMPSEIACKIEEK